MAKQNQNKTNSNLIGLAEIKQTIKCLWLLVSFDLLPQNIILRNQSSFSSMLHNLVPRALFPLVQHQERVGSGDEITMFHSSQSFNCMANQCLFHSWVFFGGGKTPPCFEHFN